MANTIVMGYETPIGNKYLITCDHYGPKSYSNIGTSSGTGDVVLAADFAKGGFDFIDVQSMGGANYTQSGNYILKRFTTTVTTTASVSYPPGSAFPKFFFQWFTTSSAFGAISTEVTNGTDLSAENIRIQLVCV